MFKGNKILTVIKKSIVKDFSIAFVSIFDKSISLYPSSYRKTDKIIIFYI